MHVDGNGNLYQPKKFVIVCLSPNTHTFVNEMWLDSSLIAAVCGTMLFVQ